MQSELVPIPKNHFLKVVDIQTDKGKIELQFQEQKRVALLFVCLNERFWPYLKEVNETADKLFLINHKVDKFIWTDMVDRPYKATYFETDPAPWPMPTLMRYHLFLQQEETLKDYDYIFYCDTDMRFVGQVDDEILGKHLTVAPHPGYHLARRYIPPYEPNPSSEAYIDRLGYQTTDSEGHPMFTPFYAAGGFQGGNTKDFLEAMHSMRDMIDKDLNNNYTAIWNDESYWNKYLWVHKDKISVFLDPGYIYPDSIPEYYKNIWGRDYTPRIVTITKQDTLKRLTNDDREKLGLPPSPFLTHCPICKDAFVETTVTKVITCQGSQKPHEVMMNQ